ncbi:hypothetical protein J5U22_00757 [Saccharolobus shibatae]|uniref:Uncharacterized protein n=1 Tax=Saccharolobus shibatae TaxID=2286 RepID=A0A8F5BZF2_9CREN|nr:hypothetical protein J5U22_00757 [Saccharolobus shibatae]
MSPYVIYDVEKNIHYILHPLEPNWGKGWKEIATTFCLYFLGV